MPVKALQPMHFRTIAPTQWTALVLEVLPAFSEGMSDESCAFLAAEKVSF